LHFNADAVKRSTPDRYEIEKKGIFPFFIFILGKYTFQTSELRWRNAILRVW